ncbi:major facilitator superfamily domain-containing protein [Obelidium mucronatum]|nr:major facilitator superfamily domain-containing protein [Obelidium mucronatum]
MMFNQEMPSLARQNDLVLHTQSMNSLAASPVSPPPPPVPPKDRHLEIEDPDSLDVPKVRLNRLEFVLVYSALILSALMYSLDQTIVSPALQSIVTDLGHSELVSWLGSAFMICSGATGILYGKLSDIFGRKPVFLFALVLFEIGSAICGAAQNMTALIVGRAITGAGGGGLASLGVIIVSDIVSLKERGKYQGITGAIYGVSAMIGPVLGGFFTEKLNWRWCFYINLPVGLVAFLVVLYFLKFPPVVGNLTEKIARVDFLGAFLLLSSTICLLTPIQLGGSTWAWNSAPVFATFLLFAILFALFLYVEFRIAKEPFVPLSIFGDRIVVGFLGMSICIGAGLFPLIYYNSLFYQFVYGLSSVDAGASTLPSMFAFVLLSIVSGIFLSRTGSYNLLFVVGPIVWILGIIANAFLTIDSSIPIRILSNLILGIGPGMIFSQRISGIQLSVQESLVAIVSGCAVTLSIIGGAIGISITGTILNNVLVSATMADEKLQKAVSALVAMGYVVDMSQFVTLLGAFDAVLGKSKDEVAGTFLVAKSQLISHFVQAFKVGTLSWIPYMVIVLALVPFIWKRGAAKVAAT